MKRSYAGTLKGVTGFYDYKCTASNHAYLNGSTKRVMDITGAVVGLILGLPIFLITALIVKIIDRVPVIFFQERFGFHGRPFMFYKLRTLKVIDERRALQIDRIQYKPQYETTRTGKLWRVTSIDEIIQFWLVLKGEMSLIGHRPLPMYYLDHLDRIDGMDKPKLAHYLKTISQFKPGMSSLSAVNGRGDLTMQQKMEFDMIYAQSASLLFDIMLLFQTVLVVITRKGAK
jgi:lipopolysaccharide/colanic/teichoic acid biosynthesis glycosyltransferase